MTRIEILAPIGFHWKPWQHVYLRVPTVGLFDKHPFTIAASDRLSEPDDKEDVESRVLPLYVRSYAGFTRRLRKHIKANPDAQLEAWLEGPYGGHHWDLSVDFDNIILVAGGGGISAVLPWLEDFALKVRAGERVQASSIKLYWSVREWSAVSWIAEALEGLQLGQLRPRFEIVVHITRDEMTDKKKGPVKRDSIELEDISSSEKAGGSESPAKNAEQLFITLRSGRIDLRGTFADLPGGSTTMVVGKSSE